MKDRNNKSGGAFLLVVASMALLGFACFVVSSPLLGCVGVGGIIGAAIVNGA